MGLAAGCFRRGFVFGHGNHTWNSLHSQIKTVRASELTQALQTPTTWAQNKSIMEVQIKHRKLQTGINADSVKLQA